MGTQLIKRSDELKDLFEKIKLQQSTLKKGEIQYKERVRQRLTLSAQKNRLREKSSTVSGENFALFDCVSGVRDSP